MHPADNGDGTGNQQYGTESVSGIQKGTSAGGRQKLPCSTGIHQKGLCRD